MDQLQRQQFVEALVQVALIESKTRPMWNSVPSADGT